MKKGEEPKVEEKERGGFGVKNVHKRAEWNRKREREGEKKG